jgi:hypothetical protein
MRTITNRRRRQLKQNKNVAKSFFIAASGLLVTAVAVPLTLVMGVVWADVDISIYKPVIEGSFKLCLSLSALSYATAGAVRLSPLVQDSLKR